MAPRSSFQKGGTTTVRLTPSAAISSSLRWYAPTMQALESMRTFIRSMAQRPMIHLNRFARTFFPAKGRRARQPFGAEICAQLVVDQARDNRARHVVNVV